MRRAVRTFLPLLAVTGLGACSAPTSSTPTLSVTLTQSPNPATASGPTGVYYTVTNPDNTVSQFEYQFRTNFTVTIQETGGMALTITAENCTVQQSAGGIVIPPSGGQQIYFKFNSTAPTNVINAKGTASVTFDVYYTLPSGGKESLDTVAFTFQDTANPPNTYSQSIGVKVAP